MNSNFHQIAEVELLYPKVTPNKIDNCFKQNIFDAKYET